VGYWDMTGKTLEEDFDRIPIFILKIVNILSHCAVLSDRRLD